MPLFRFSVSTVVSEAEVKQPRDKDEQNLDQINQFVLLEIHLN